jgi:hypothetical protein
LANHASVNIHGAGQLGFWDALFGGVGNMDAAGTDEKRLAPGAVEGRNIGGEGDDGGGEIEERRKTDSGAKEDFAGFDFECGRDACDGGASGSWVTDKTEHDF